MHALPTFYREKYYIGVSSGTFKLFACIALQLKCKPGKATLLALHILNIFLEV